MNQLYLHGLAFYQLLNLCGCFLVGDGWYAPTCKRCHNTPSFVPRSRSTAGGGANPATTWLQGTFPEFWIMNFNNSVTHL